MGSVGVKKHTIFLIRIILGLVFVVSGTAKFFDLPTFRDVLQDFGILSNSLLVFVSIAIPCAELVPGLLLLLGLWTRYASAVIICLLFIFIIAIIPIISTSKQIDCGCFGPLMQSRISIDLLIRDVLLLLFAIYIYSEGPSVYSIDRITLSR